MVRYVDAMQNGEHERVPFLLNFLVLQNLGEKKIFNKLEIKGNKIEGRA